MKIALLTIWHCGNYGAELQAYATYRALSELGHSVSIIDFRENETENKNIKSRIARLINRSTITNLKFTLFWHKYLPKKTCHYKTIKDLIKNPPNADVYIVGSDQVWNYNITKQRAAAYFLSFGNNSIRRMSFASSFGIRSWNATPDFTQKVQEWLNNFEAISCREKSGIEILNNVFNLKATQVLDPTLLFNDYSELLHKKPSTKKTLVYYPLSENPDMEKFAIDLAKQLNLKFKNINKGLKLTRTIVINKLSIQKWIKSIAEAQLVITPSFHGLAFSLVFHKQFIIISNNINQDRNVRMTDLLDTLNLNNRYFSNIKDVQDIKPWEEHIDYKIVDKKLNELRKLTRDYLKNI